MMSVKALANVCLLMMALIGRSESLNVSIEFGNIKEMNSHVSLSMISISLTIHYGFFWRQVVSIHIQQK